MIKYVILLSSGVGFLIAGLVLNFTIPDKVGVFPCVVGALILYYAGKAYYE